MIRKGDWVLDLTTKFEVQFGREKITDGHGWVTGLYLEGMGQGPLRPTSSRPWVLDRHLHARVVGVVGRCENDKISLVDTWMGSEVSDGI